MKKSVYEMVKERVLNVFEKVDSEWKVPYLYPKNYLSGYEYRGINRILLMSSPFWLTNNQLSQLHEKKGWKLKKGSRSSIAVFYKIYEIEEEDPKTGETTIKQIPILRYYHLFSILDVVDSEGKPVYRPEQRTEELNELVGVLNNYCKMEGIKIVETPEAECSFYSPDKDLIGMYPFFKSEIDRIMTLSHEVIHSTKAEKRLNRNLEREVEEAVAEFGSLLLTAKYVDIPKDKFLNAVRYIKGWLRNATGRQLMKIFSASEDAVSFVIEKSKLNQKAA